VRRLGGEVEADESEEGKFGSVEKGSVEEGNGRKVEGRWKDARYKEIQEAELKDQIRDPRGRTANFVVI
jgi:hypothetical protein